MVDFNKLRLDKGFITQEEYDHDALDSNNEEKILESFGKESDESFGIEETINENVDFPCECILGPAGSGKSFRVKQKIAAEGDSVLVTGTTGIAALNIGGATIHSTLGFFDEQSMADSLVEGHLKNKIISLAKKGVKTLVLDELSLFNRFQLDYLVDAFQQANQRLHKENKEIGLMLVGDFAQLPPIYRGAVEDTPWAFLADSWPRFSSKLTVLKKIWRQEDPKFLEALTYLRAGDGKNGTEALTACGVKFAPNRQASFEGTTILPKNDMVGAHNLARYRQLTGKEQELKPSWWGKVEKDVLRNIPDGKLKVGAYVMILANDLSGILEYVNGSTGHVVGFEPGVVVVDLGDGNGNQRTVKIRTMTRFTESREEPLGGYAETKEEALTGQAYWDEEKRKFILGAVRYLPIRLAYASTVHKMQGQTIQGPLQIDPTNAFFGFPSMAYVAISRATKAENLRIVGSPRLLEMRVKTDPQVLPFV